MNAVKSDAKQRQKRAAGGSATGSGMNFQAVVTALAGVHLLKGRSLDWLSDLADDTPVAVWAETGGGGDDIRLELRGGPIAEVQVKRGLRAGNKLWDSLMSLATAIDVDDIQYGVLAVSPDSSGTIRRDLSEDLRRLADGRADGLKSQAETLKSKLEGAGLKPQSICARIRIAVVHGLDSDQVSITAAKGLLESLLSDKQHANVAWNRLYREAHAIIERRGRWEASSIVRIFESEGIGISESDTPVAVLARLTRWAIDTNSDFSLFGVKVQLSISENWLPLKIRAREFNEILQSDAAQAMQHYHATEVDRSADLDARVSDAEWVGRFYTRAVLIGGPGLGKSTLLTRVAQAYARDGFPILKVKLSAVAARMVSGHTFVDSVFELGLDGSGISPVEARAAGFRNWVLLCDGMDECGERQDDLAKELQKFASGYPNVRIVVTTRLIGYSTTKISDWRHYELLPPESRDGPSNIAKLIRASLSESEELHAKAHTVARSELEKSGSSEIISRSPLLMGMTVSLLINEGELGRSKTQLYHHLFAMIEASPNTRSTGSSESKPVLARMIDILGWQLVAEPLESMSRILERCAHHLAIELDTPPLSARDVTTKSLQHWEEVGLVERVHHGSKTMLTFVHKTFTEFAAARFLRDIEPSEKRELEIKSRMKDVAWAEVLNFASEIGLANSFVAVVASNGASATTPQLERALVTLTRADPPVLLELKRQIIELAFDRIDSNESSETFLLGSALADAARIDHALLLSHAKSRTKSSQFSSRLIAWTCVAEAGSEFYELDELPIVIRTFTAEISPIVTTSLMGGFRMSARGGHELLQRLVLLCVRRIVDEWPSEKSRECIEEILDDEKLNTVGFQNRLYALRSELGSKFELPERFTIEPFELNLPSFRHAAYSARKALLSSLVSTEELLEADALERSVAVHLSAFLGIVGFHELVPSDVWDWVKSYDSDVLREVMIALAKISPVDLQEIREDAAAILKRIDELEEAGWARVLPPSGSVDVPPLDWSMTKRLKVDRSKLEKALGYESAWLVEAATNLIGSLGEVTPQQAAKALMIGKSFGLAGAAYLTAKLEPSTAANLLIDRIEGPHTPGIHHLFETLNSLSPPWNSRLASAVQTGLMSDEYKLAAAAAELALKYVENGARVDAGLCNKAYEHWTILETDKPESPGPVTISPRKALLKGLAKLGDVNDEKLMDYCGDARADVRETAEDILLDRLEKFDHTRLSFVSRTKIKTCPANLLSRALDAAVPFSNTDVERLSALLGDEAAVWRLACSKLLHPNYMQRSEIAHYCEKLANDPHEEVRSAIKRIASESESV